MSARLLLLLITLPFLATAQVRLNEAVSSNSVYTDEDGDTPDWLELHNAGDTAADLTGFTLSDKPDNPGKWPLPELRLGPDEYIFLWASGKDRSAAFSYRTFVDRGDDFRYLLPTGPVTNAWNTLSYDDRAWPTGPSGFGYDDGDDQTVVANGTRSVFVRRKFTLNNLAQVTAILFDIDYDDGFVAYLNGTEIARANMTGSRPAWDAFATQGSEARIINEAPPQRFVLNQPETLLREGENVLAVQVHNVTAFSSDLSLIPFLTLQFSGSNQEGRTPPALLDLPRATLHTNFKLAADGETLVLHDASGELVDSLGLYGLPANVSIGIPGNGGSPQLFRTTTPGQQNPDTGFTGVVRESVSFSEPGGIVDAFSLRLSGATAPNQIRYTLDATVPTAASPVYTGPIAITETTIVRAAIFRPNYLPSPTQTTSYLLGVDHDLPVVSLVTAPDNFFHPETGMYVLGEGYEGDFPYFGSNIWEETEQPISFSFYEPDGSNRFQLDGGVKIFGGWSRANPQRSLSLFARGRYGDNAMVYPFFQQRNYEEFQALVLRNSGNENGQTMLRDVFLTSLMEDSHVDIQAYRPVASYLNGAYWGIYNLREKINEHYLASLHGHAPTDINLLEFNGDVIHGSNEDYLAMISFVNTNSLSSEANYRRVADQLDVDNFVQYFAAQIYFDNRDWPGNNIKYWKPDGGRWRWILFDTDFGAGIWDGNAFNFNTLAYALEANGPNWPNPPWSTLLFRRLMGNTSFRHRFINQMADEMNSRFLSTPVIHHLNERAAAIELEIPRHHERWSINYNWENGLETMRNFFRNRPGRMKTFIKDQFNLPAHHRLTIRLSDTDEGYVEVNSLTIDQTSWIGDYFQNVPIRVKAVARAGYTFQHWELDNGTADPELTLNLNRPTALRPVFSLTTNLDAVPAGSLATVSDLVISPNPVAETLRLSFTLTKRSHLTGRLFDPRGRQLRQFFDTDFGAGPQVQSFELEELTPGTYFLHLQDQLGGQAILPWVKR